MKHIHHVIDIQCYMCTSKKQTLIGRKKYLKGYQELALTKQSGKCNHTRPAARTLFPSNALATSSLTTVSAVGQVFPYNPT